MATFLVIASQGGEELPPETCFSYAEALASVSEAFEAGFQTRLFLLEQKEVTISF